MNESFQLGMFQKKTAGVAWYYRVKKVVSDKGLLIFDKMQVRFTSRISQAATWHKINTPGVKVLYFLCRSNTRW